jgi:hypothetical protein
MKNRKKKYANTGPFIPFFSLYSHLSYCLYYPLAVYRKKKVSASCKNDRDVRNIKFAHKFRSPINKLIKKKCGDAFLPIHLVIGGNHEFKWSKHCGFQVIWIVYTSFI